MRIRLTNLAALAIILIPGIGISQEKNAQGFHTHDGLYVALGAGFANFSTRLQGPTFSQKSSNFSSVLDIKIGGTLVNNRWILSGDLIRVDADEPGFNYNSRGNITFGTYESLNLALMGIGITRYFVPLNAFLSGTFGVGRINFVGGKIPSGNANIDDFGISQSDIGFGFQLKVGKEFWITKNLALGFSAYLISIRVPHQTNDLDYNESLEGMAFGFMPLSLTFN